MSVNKDVMGGVPNHYIIKEGDLITFDVAIKYKGYYVDKAISFGIEPLNYDSFYLIHSLKLCVERALEVIRPGCYVSSIGGMIERTALAQGLYVGKNFYGHGIGIYKHESPAIPNFNNRDKFVLKPNMVITIEPVLFFSLPLLFYPNNYTISSDTLSVHAEETVFILEDGMEVVT
jgi:methionyl aminopeptidase